MFDLQTDQDEYVYLDVPALYGSVIYFNFALLKAKFAEFLLKKRPSLKFTEIFSNRTEKKLK